LATPDSSAKTESTARAFTGSVDVTGAPARMFTESRSPDFDTWAWGRRTEHRATLEITQLNAPNKAAIPAK
jgi:hypothetical protein